MSEFEFINWIRKQTSPADRVLLGPGDDTAALFWPKDSVSLWTTDMLLEGSCFLLAEAGAHRVGRKSIAVNLSDIAAMAGKPIAALVSVALPKSGGRVLGEELYRGMREMADQFSMPIVGGDTSAWSGALAISVTILGEATGSGPVKRSGAKVNDWIMVTGPLGGSIYGHHLDFTPRVAEAQRLHQCVDLHAMIDISDGLSADLWHICEESNVGAVLFAENIPINDVLKEKVEQQFWIEHALRDGEDFELLFTVSPDDGAQLLRDQPIPGITLYHIGECVEEQQLFLRQDGQVLPINPTGYVHYLN